MDLLITQLHKINPSLKYNPSREIKKSNGSATWPPTTATEGRASQREENALSPPPWSPRAVQALWIRFTKPIKLSIYKSFLKLNKEKSWTPDLYLLQEKKRLVIKQSRFGLESGTVLFTEIEKGKTRDGEKGLWNWTWFSILFKESKYRGLGYIATNARNCPFDPCMANRCCTFPFLSFSNVLEIFWILNFVGQIAQSYIKKVRLFFLVRSCLCLRAFYS